jgi:hypothetical protein
MSFLEGIRTSVNYHAEEAFKKRIIMLTTDGNDFVNFNMEKSKKLSKIEDGYIQAKNFMEKLTFNR